MADAPKVDRDGGTSVYTTNIGLGAGSRPDGGLDGGTLPPDGGSSIPDGGNSLSNGGRLGDAGMSPVEEDGGPDDGFVRVPPRMRAPAINLPLCPYLSVASGGNSIGQLGHLSDKKQVYICEVPDKPSYETLVGVPFSEDINFENCRAPSSAPKDVEMLSKGVSVAGLNAAGKQIAQIPMNMCALKLGAIPLTSNFGDNRPTNVIAYKSDESKAICGKGLLDNSGLQDFPDITLSANEARLLINLGPVRVGGMCRKEPSQIQPEDSDYFYQITTQHVIIKALIARLEDPEKYIRGKEFPDANLLIAEVKKLGKKRKEEIINALKKIPSLTGDWYRVVQTVLNFLTTLASNLALPLTAAMLFVFWRSANPKKIKDPLKLFGRDYNDLARKGEFKGLDASLVEAQLERTRLTLAQGKSDAFVGPPGRGKSVAAKLLALGIERGDYPELKGTRIIELDLNRMVAGTRNRGDFEERLQAVIDEVIRLYEEKGERVILFADELHRLMGFGSAEGITGGEQVLKPYLADGRIVILGATTPEEFERYVARDRALNDRFARNEFPPLDRKGTFKALKAQAEVLGKGKVRKALRIDIKDDAILKVIELADSKWPERGNPRKSVDMLSHIVAYKRVHGGKIGGDPHVLTADDVQAAFDKVFRNGNGHEQAEGQPPAGPVCKAPPKAPQVVKFKGAINDPQFKAFLTRLPEPYRRAILGQAGQILDALMQTGRLEGAAMMPDGTVQVSPEVYERVVRASYAVVHSAIQEQHARAAAPTAGQVAGRTEERDPRRPERAGEGLRAGERARDVVRPGEERREEARSDGQKGVLEGLQEEALKRGPK